MRSAIGFGGGGGCRYGTTTSRMPPPGRSSPPFARQPVSRSRWSEGTRCCARRAVPLQSARFGASGCPCGSGRTCASRALIVARAQAGPARDVGCSGEDGHVHAQLGDEDFSRPPVDPGDGVQVFQVSAKGARSFSSRSLSVANAAKVKSGMPGGRPGRGFGGAGTMRGKLTAVRVGTSEACAGVARATSRSILRSMAWARAKGSS
jgi:hypothetical protein